MNRYRLPQPEPLFYRGFLFLLLVDATILAVIGLIAYGLWEVYR